MANILTNIARKRKINLCTTSVMGVGEISMSLRHKEATADRTAGEIRQVSNSRII